MSGGCRHGSYIHPVTSQEHQPLTAAMTSYCLHLLSNTRLLRKGALVHLCWPLDSSIISQITSSHYLFIAVLFLVVF